MRCTDAAPAEFLGPRRCDWCGSICSSRTYHFDEKNFPEHFACSPSCYAGVVARAISSPVFTAPPTMNLREAHVRRRP